MLALAVRQPYAELILRGTRTVEYRSRATRIVGERFYLYAAGKWARNRTKPIWSRDLSVPDDRLPPWMIELANGLRLFPHDLPAGVIVGSAVIEKCTPYPLPEGEGKMWQWHLADVQRAKRLRKPVGHPQPVWFTPFD